MTLKLIDELADLNRRVEARCRQDATTLAAKLAYVDLPGTMTDREKEAHEKRRHDLQIEIKAYPVQMQRALDLGNQVAALYAQKPVVEARTGWRKQAVEEAIPLSGAHPRTPEATLFEQYLLSIKYIDKGAKVMQGSPWTLAELPLTRIVEASGFAMIPPSPENPLGGLPGEHLTVDGLDREIADLEKRIANERVFLDNYARSDDERIAHAAAVKAKNLEPVLKTRLDGSQFLRHRDGSRTEVPSDAPPKPPMTVEQLERILT